MTSRRPLAVTAAAAATAALLLLPTAAQAHDPSVVWLVVEHDDDGESSTRSIGTAAKSDAALTALPTALSSLEVYGLDIRDEQGYGVGWSYDDSEDLYGLVALLWDHATGAAGATAALSMSPGALQAFLGGDAPEYEDVWVNDAWGLDAAPGASILTIVDIEAEYWDGEFPDSDYFTLLASVDIATGALTPLALVYDSNNEVRPSWWFTDIATDPTTGTVYLVGYIDVYDDEEEGYWTYPAVAVADLAAGTIGAPEVLSGVVDAFEGAEGEAYGADFESDGRLWLSAEIYEFSPYLMSFAPGFTATAAAVVSGGLYGGDVEFARYYSLAVEDAPKLPDTGAPAPIALAGLALVAAAAGAGAIAIQRRRGRTAA